jgi:S-adenosylmethionine hydrolase
MTDFGLKDGNVGVMKGVILSIAPEAQIVDLSHLISPQNLREAALILLRSAPYFPPGTIHVVVVDPGVGTERRPMAARIGSQLYVGPDNGIITMLLERARKHGETTQFIHLDKPEYWLPEVSHVFHGRDIFAPAAGHLAAGVKLEELGTTFDDLVQIKLEKTQVIPGGLRGEIIHIDHFGNAASNIRVEDVGERSIARVRVGEVEIVGMVKAFGERPPGEIVALYGSTGNLIISVVNGSAAERLGIEVGERVEVRFGR